MFVAVEAFGLPTEHKYLFQWIHHKCQGRSICDPFDNTLPEWWYYIDDESTCDQNTSTGSQYFVGVQIDYSCVGMYSLYIVGKDASKSSTYIGRQIQIIIWNWGNH